MVTVSYLLRHGNLLQNATDVVTKCDSYFIAKCESFVTKCETYYKVRHLLQNLSVQTVFSVSLIWRTMKYFFHKV